MKKLDLIKVCICTMKTIMIVIMIGFPLIAFSQFGKIYGNEEDISRGNIKSITEEVETSIDDSTWMQPTYIRFYDTSGSPLARIS